MYMHLFDENLGNRARYEFLRQGSSELQKLLAHQQITRMHNEQNTLYTTTLTLCFLIFCLYHIPTDLI